MDFSKALLMLKQGHKIARKNNEDYWFINELIAVHSVKLIEGTNNVQSNLSYVIPKVIVAKLKGDKGFAPVQPTHEDILADDWVVIDE